MVVRNFDSIKVNWKHYVISLLKTPLYYREKHKNIIYAQTDTKYYGRRPHQVSCYKQTWRAPMILSENIQRQLGMKKIAFW